MSVSFGGFNKETATFKATSSMAKGAPVKISANGTVSPAGIGNAFCGIIEECDGEYATVQLYGEITVEYTDTAPSLGYSKLVSASVGVRIGEAGREYLVVSVDETARTVTFLL